MGQYAEQMIRCVIQDVADVWKYFFAGLAVFLAAGIFSALAVKVRGENGKRIKGCLGTAVMAGYLCMLLFITFLSREPGSRGGIDWILLSTLGSGPRGDAFVLENVLLFIPFGVLLPAVSVKMRRFGRTFGEGCILSLFIECFQFITKRGYAQTDDVITNALGTALGYLCFRIFFHFFTKKAVENGR